MDVGLKDVSNFLWLAGAVVSIPKFMFVVSAQLRIFLLITAEKKQCFQLLASTACCVMATFNE